MELFPENTRLLVLYDGACPLCRRSVDWLQRHDRRRVLHCLPLQAEGILAATGIPLAEAMVRLQVVSRSGERRQGADAALWATAALPGWGWLRLLACVPGAMPGARAVYRHIARRRARDLQCDSACDWH